MTDGKMAAGIEEAARTIPQAPFQILIEPPLTFEVEDVKAREARLAVLIADKVVPRLLALHNSVADADTEISIHAGEQEIAELSRLVLGPDNSDDFNFVVGLKDAGLSLDLLYLELLEPTARHLGELWDTDKVDFIDVTIGLVRLQRLVRAFAGLDDDAPYDEKCRALLIATPGEHHVFGNTIVQRFFRAAGWHVCSGPVSSIDELTKIVSREWFGIVGFSLSADKNMESLAQSIAAVRAKSLNKNAGVIVGGPAFSGRPERAIDVGADGTAVNAPTAVILAKKLLVPSLSQAGG